ncbi:MAG: hypothetical protein KBC48_02935 [Candidatus Pacebacteria bacterium]|nr:hypothetical protein [Candidatus Paceibacterota bacterium]
MGKTLPVEKEVSTFDPPATHKLAREIMGKNFFGIEEAIKYYGVNPSEQQLAYLAEIPFSEEVLKSCKDTHILIAVFLLSIIDVRSQLNSNLFRNHDSDAWYNNQAFAANKGVVGWWLVRKTPVADSLHKKNWDEQQALLDKGEQTPTARIMVYTIIGHYLANGEHLFENVYIRCSDLDSVSCRVWVGSPGFNFRGLDIVSGRDSRQFHTDGLYHYNLGISSARNYN